MTDEETGKVISILMQVDGGCPACVRVALEAFATAFPDSKRKCVLALKAATGEDWDD